MKGITALGIAVGLAGSFLLKKEERKKDFLQISWNRLNELLTVKKYRKTVEK